MARHASRAPAPAPAPRTPPTATAGDGPRYWARQPFDYGALQLDRGQILRLAGAPNDEKLRRLGYVAELDGQITSYECAVCGGAFVGIAERTAHGNKRHAPRLLTPDEEDAAEEREEQQLQAVAPLYLDKTKAAMGVA